MTHQDRTMEEQVAHPAAVTDLAADLAEQRALAETRRRDRRTRRWDRALHRIGLADVRERAATASWQRRERRRDAREEVELAELYRRAEVSGARARMASRIQQSAEVRALRVARVRQVSLRAGLPVLAAFAAWSTAGVHRGVTTLLDLPAGSPGWWAAWGVEPALITIVGLVIIGRAWLRSAGGDVDWRAITVEWGALTTSILLNLAGAGLALSLTALPGLVAHSVGPVGCAVTAWLIATFDSYVRKATPFEGKGVKALAELDLSGRPAAHRSPAQSAHGDRSGRDEREQQPERSRSLLSEADYERLLSAQPADERTPVEPAAAHRSERSTTHSATAERRSLVAQMLAENPDMTGPEIAEALGERLGRPVSVATAKRDRAAVQQEQD